MNVLVLNSGSSSLKYKLFDMPAEHLLAAGMVERIGDGRGRVRLITGEPEDRREIPCPDGIDHRQALDFILAVLGQGSGSGYTTVGLITLVAHRLVHGGESFSGPVRVDDHVLDRLTPLQALAPLHMPQALSVLRACRRLLPRACQVACFDTGFYDGMPPHTRMYAVPRAWYIEHGIRRFGFHGLSHQYVTRHAAALLDIPSDRIKLISAHLGNGASITAYDRGRVLDTSMGFTPLEGLVMGTRCGYLDPAALLHLQRRTGMDLAQMVDILNTQSGLQGVSGIGRDLRAIMEARAEGHAGAALAVEMYVHTLRKYIGAYHFALRGAQALVFTGGVGENSADIRTLVLDGWRCLGLDLDAAANRRMVDGRAGLVSTGTSPVRILVVPTDEERLMARQALALMEVPIDA